MTSFASNRSLKVIEINVSSLISIKRRNDLSNFLGTHKPNVVLLVETNLSSIHKLSFPNYSFIRSDKTPSHLGRGTGILINNNLHYDKLNTTHWNLKSLETTALVIKSGNNNYLLVAAYRFTKGPACFDTTDLNTIASINNSYPSCSLILGGDLNARHENWLNRNRCSNGIVLNNWLLNNALNQSVQLVHSKEPTFYRGTYTSHLDVFIVSDHLNIRYPATSPNQLAILDYPSDHRAVIIEIVLSAPVTRATPITIPNFAKTDWRSFNDVIDTGISQIFVPNNQNMSTEQIDTAVSNITKLLQATIDTTVPKVTIRSSTQIPIPDSLKNIIDQKNLLRRRWQRLRYSHSQYRLRSEIQCLEKIIKDKLRIVHIAHWEKTLKGIKIDNHTFSNIKRFTKKHSNISIPGIIDPVTAVHTSDDFEKANIIGKQFEKVHCQNIALGSPTFNDRVKFEVQSTVTDVPSTRTHFSQHETVNPVFTYRPERHLVSMNTLYSIIKSRANKKSKGEDGISNYVIKRLSNKFNVLLAMLFNQAYNIAYFPQAWKKALIVPLLKKGKPPTAPSSYRPISLLSCMSKLFECCIKIKLLEDCESLHVLPQDQFAHQTTLSAQLPVIKFSTDICSNLNTGTPTIACTLDVEKPSIPFG